MKFEELKKGIMVYIDREFCNKLGAGDWRRWAIPLFSQLAAPALEKKYRECLPALKSASIVDENECIDLNNLYTKLRQISVDQGNIIYPLPLLGNTTFSTADVDSIYKILRELSSPVM